MSPQEEIHSILNNSIEQFKSISEQDWEFKRSPEKWSRKEVVGHLIDSAVTNLRRFVMTQYKPKENIVYHQDEWVQLQNYQAANIQDSIDLWRLLNLQIIRTIDGISHEKLQNLCDTGKEGQELYTLEFLIEDYVSHLKHHLKQVLG